MGLVEFVKNSLFPKICFGCGRLGVYICTSCFAKLVPTTHDQCPYCRKASYFGLTHPGCSGTLRINGLKSFYYYSPLARKIIKSIKYRLVQDAMDDFLNTIPNDRVSELFFYKKIAKSTTLIPVPLHSKRHARRGFNQSAEITNYFSAKLGFPVNDTFISRSRNTVPQATLKTHRDRYKNILGAFKLTDKATSRVKNGNFIIVDDVWTSGSTIKEICRTLKRNGAHKVFALTLVR